MTWKILSILVLFAALPSCVARTVSIHTGNLATNAELIRTTGKARVYDSTGELVTVNANTKVDVLISGEKRAESDQADADTRVSTTIGNLVAGCTNVDGSKCLVNRVSGSYVEIGRKTQARSGALESAIGGTIALAGATYCFIECESPAIVFVTVGAIAGASLLFLTLLAFAK
jgi:hypothetical protein